MLIGPLVVTILVPPTLAAIPADPCATAPAGRVVPADLRGHRFFARWQQVRGSELRFYLDTGGGTNMLFDATVRRLGLSLDTVTVDGQTGTTVSVARDLGTASFPALTNGVPNSDSSTIRLYVPAPEGEGGMLQRSFQLDSLVVDGFLGQPWFADRIWTFDYPGRRLLVHDSGAAAALPVHCWVPLGFQTDSSGKRTFNFPRITALVDGDSIDLLFDTGAMTTLTDSAWRLIDPREPRHRATSFITRTRFEQWHARHPNWLVVEQAEEGTGAPMIRVPHIEVGGTRLGPVWFTGRPDGNFHEFMSQMMDRRIDGALGGSALRYATVVVDYPGSRAAVLRSTP